MRVPGASAQNDPRMSGHAVDAPSAGAPGRPRASRHNHAGAMARKIRRIVLTESKRVNVGHIGSCLCVVDILSVLYGRILNVPSPDAADRDRFILSKGHAGLALYAALHLRGWLSRAELHTFFGEATLLGVHPEHAIAGVDFSTGSLGHGIGLSVGAALAAKLERSGRRVVCLLSDGECNEGSVWEAVMFAAHRGLDNLTAIVDFNGQQAFGSLADVIDQRNLVERWRCFGWEAEEVDGHDIDGLTARLSAPPRDARPRVLVARTVFGKGVSFMERGVARSRPDLRPNRINWHYLPMSDSEYAQAMAELEGPG